MADKSSAWRPGPTVCRCCLAEGCYKDISTEYFWMGKREVYADMLADTLSLSIGYSKTGGPNSNSRLICEPCISRLRDATDFKRQVQECEKTFMQYLDPGSSSVMSLMDSDDIQMETIEKDVKIEQVKVEKKYSDDEFDSRDFGDDDDDDDDMDQPLTTFASKEPKKETINLLDLLESPKKKTTKPKLVAKKKIIIKKDVKVKPTTSKAVPKSDDKKRKETGPRFSAKTNAEIILKCSTIYPFRMQAKSLMCVYCCDEFEDPVIFRQHVDEIHQDFTITTAFAHLGRGKDSLKVDCTNMKCRLCAETAETLEEMAEHILQFHNNRSTYKLNLDYKIGLHPYKLEKNQWQCCLCNEKLPSLVKLCRHTTSHYLLYTCDTCGRRYLTAEALKYHMRCNHSGKNICRKCWRDFPSLETRKEHVKTTKKCWPFSCVYCGDRFLSWEQKQKHLVDNHGRRESTYTCPECSMVFQTRKLFYSHYKVMHTDDSYICTCCGLRFESKNRLDDHRLGHTGEKTFKCHICDKSFLRKKSLTQHLWIHSDNKRFSCVLCEKQFAQKVSLKCHMKSHHPDVVLKL